MMMDICQVGVCTGCSGCDAACPVGAIEMAQNEKGFYRPRIDEGVCLDCGKCREICPANQESQAVVENQEVFAAWSRQEEIRLASSSGGVFSHLAEQVLEAGGVVFGGSFLKDFTIGHCGIETVDDLARLRGSKYVQSRMGENFKKVKSFLTCGRQVLFAGTPCQIAGLKKILTASERENLLLVDLVCHGAASPKLYRDYLNYQADLRQDRIVQVSFRSKPEGWKNFGMSLTFEKSENYFADVLTDPYLVGFLKNYFLNDSCYRCQFANTNRQGDVTIADFWGYQEEKDFLDDDRGITLVITNTPKGRAHYEAIRKKVIDLPKTLVEAAAGNGALNRPTFKNRRYEEFWQDYENEKFSFLIEKYFAPRGKQKKD